MNGEKQITWEWRAGYDYATEKYKAELDRLRAERDDWKGCTGALKTIKDAKEKDFQAEIEKLHEECAGFRAQIHIERDEATMFQSKQCTEIDRLRAELVRLEWIETFSKGVVADSDRLRAENAELRRCMGSARTAIVGRDYRNALAELEDAIEELAKTAKEGE